MSWKLIIWTVRKRGDNRNFLGVVRRPNFFTPCRWPRRLTQALATAPTLRAATRDPPSFLQSFTYICHLPWLKLFAVTHFKAVKYKRRVCCHFFSSWQIVYFRCLGIVRGSDLVDSTSVNSTKLRSQMKWEESLSCCAFIRIFLLSCIINEALVVVYF